MSDVRYRTRIHENGPFRDQRKLERTVQNVMDAMKTERSRARILWPGEGDFGPELGRLRTRSKLLWNLPRPHVVGVGDVVSVFLTKGTRRLRIRKEQLDLGAQVRRAALSQLGVPYIWADEDPAGGGSAGFDCSGLTRWCYSHVGVEIPHSAYQQSLDSQVRFVKDDQTGARARVRAGDLVFYHTGRLSVIDHVGIVGDDGCKTVIDASSTLDAVVHREIDANPVVGFGRVEKVNGPW